MQQCITPLLYQHIILRTAIALQSLSSQLITSYSTDHGSHARTLVLKIRSPSHDHLSNVLTLLVHMPYLRKFSTELQVTPNELSVLARTCGATLQSCNIPLLDEGRTTISALERLSSFSSLQALEVFAMWPSYADDIDYINSTFTIPSLKRLSLRTIGPSSCINFLLYSHLPALVSLELHFQFLDEFFFHALETFLQHHPHIANLTLNAIDDWTEQILGIPMSPTFLTFAGGIPSMRTLERIPASVHAIALRECEWTGRLWEFMQVLLLALPGTTLREIWVSLPEGFSWSLFAAVSLSDEHALFFGKMLYYAQRLRMRGLELLDESGETMNAAFPAH